MIRDQDGEDRGALPRRRLTTGRWTEVLVVGGGISGCACAAGLAARGIPVTVISSALDSIGQPAYGPEVTGDKGTWEEIREVLGALPGVLRGVWLAASVAPADGAGFFAVDRRMLSVETKRALEGMPGLRFRQGLVTRIALSGEGEGGGPRRVVVETAFGEAIEGDAVVIAVGVALGGHVVAGKDVLPGGRYGETPSDGLRGALEQMGAEFAEVRLRVGPRFLRDAVGLDGREGRDQAGQQAWQQRGDKRGRDALVGLRVSEGVALETVLGWEPNGAASGGAAPWGRRSTERPSWPAEFPPAPNWTDELRLSVMGLGRGDGVRDVPALLPDGLATGEVWVENAGADSGAHYPPASRLEHMVVGRRVVNLAAGGKLASGTTGEVPVWVTGRASGAETYLESLGAGMRVAADVAKASGEGFPRMWPDCDGGGRGSWGRDPGGCGARVCEAEGADGPDERCAAEVTQEGEEGGGAG